jgi:hypothetical protein
MMAVVIMAEDEHDQKRIEDIIAKAVKVKVVWEIIGCCTLLTCSFDRMERLKTLEHRLPLQKSDGLLPKKRRQKQRKQRLY